MHFIPVERHYRQQENSVRTQNIREAITIEEKRSFCLTKTVKKKNKKASCIITGIWKYTAKKLILLAGKGQGDNLNLHLSEVSLKLRTGFLFKL